MSKTETQLRSFVSSIQGQSDLSSLDVVNIMRLARTIIEDDGDQARYPTLYLFCHLGAHSRLTRANNLAILERLNQAFVDYARSPHAGEALVRALRLAELRAELIRLLEAKNIDAPILRHSAGWIRFLQRLFEDIDGRVVALPPGVEQMRAKSPEKKMFDAMAESSRIVYGNPWFPISVSFELRDDGYPSVIPRLAVVIQMLLLPVGEIHTIITSVETVE